MKSESPIFCIDTNVFVLFYRFYPRTIAPDLWDNLETLFSEGRIISHKIVFDEICHDLKNPDEIAKWIIPKESYFEPINQRQTILLPEILRFSPNLIDYNREREQADPWLIAMMIEKNELNDNCSYIMVSNESKNSPKKVPAACKNFNIECIDLIEFFEINNWKLNIK